MTKTWQEILKILKDAPKKNKKRRKFDGHTYLLTVPYNLWDKFSKQCQMEGRPYKTVIMNMIEYYISGEKYFIESSDDKHYLNDNHDRDECNV